MLEALEPRIAPATLFMNAAAGSVGSSIVDSAGNAANDSAAEQSAQTKTSSDFAVLLNAGDRLVFDADDNHSFAVAKGDFNLVQVTAGQAMVFFKDLDSNSRLDPWEVTGLAVSDKFNGTVDTDIHGSVVTALAGGSFTTSDASHVAVQNASIAGLRVAGFVEGGIYAGGNISGVRAGQGIYASVGYSVLGIAAGTDSTDHDVSFDGSHSLLKTQFGLGNALNKNGVNGASITGITLSYGTFSIEAGDGQSAEGTGNGGHGGSISNVQVNTGFKANPSLPSAGIYIDAGDAGHGGLNGGKGIGGNGGSVTNVKVTQADATVVLNNGIECNSGAGGDGYGLKSNGGFGGSISGVKFNILSPMGTGNAGFEAMAGGDAHGDGDGGAGGSITNSSISIGGQIGFVDNSGTAPVLDGWIDLNSGVGGKSYGGGKGGAGGSVTNLTVQQLDENSTFEHIRIEANDGGGMENGDTFLVSTGGAGGSITGLNLLCKGTIGQPGMTEGRVIIIAGPGGAGTVQGGAGGALTNSSVVLGNIASDHTQFISAGNGGSLFAGTAGVAGGNGGALSNLSFRINDMDGDANFGAALVGTFQISSGVGGDGGVNMPGLSPMANTGSGGNGGALSGLTIDGIDDFGNLLVAAGNGGMAGDLSTKVGGNGGALTGVTARFSLDASNDGSADIHAGRGGDANLLGSAGGNGGSLANVNLSFLGGLTGDGYTSNDTLRVEAGDGGHGGNGTYDQPTDTFTLTGKGKGGAGGSLSAVKINVQESMNSLSVTAGDGGQAGNYADVPNSILTGWAAGGNGGAASNITVTTPTLSGNATGTPIFKIAGGDGGSGSTGGTGGTISNVTAFTGTDGEEHGIEGDDDFVQIRGGNGGGGDEGNGGAAGAATNIVLEGTDFAMKGTLLVGGGEGGYSNKAVGGAGGSLTNAKIDVEHVVSFVPPGAPFEDGSTPMAIRVVGGSGGDGLKGGGTGGSISQISIRTLDIGDIYTDDLGNVQHEYPGGLFVGAGAGGSGGYDDYNDATGKYTMLDPGKGGNGGSASGVTVEVGDVFGQVGINAGDGGSSVGNAGGTGGALSNVKLTNFGEIAGYPEKDETPRAIIISSGDGGEVLGKGKGGNAASLSSVTITNHGGIKNGMIQVFAGGGGDADLEDGGAAGSISGLTIFSQAPLGSEGIQIETESGGDSNVANGGNAGSITNVKIVGESAGGELYISTNVGGNGGSSQGSSATSKGGAGGSISKVALDTPAMNVFIGEAGLEGYGNAQGGNAGKISEVSGEVGELSIMARGGGHSNPALLTGKGGNGGSIDKINIAAVASAVKTIAAGSGGNAAQAANVGAGGSVTNVFVDGDIGDFQQAFGQLQGGILAGQGGIALGKVVSMKNGSVTGITADRIASIIAANTTMPFPPQPNLLSGDFSVFKLDKIAATMIGANFVENDGKGTITKRPFSFDFVDNTASPSVFDNADLPLDGLVIARTSGYVEGVSTSVLPLHVVTT